jgi:iron complex transport system substrate-binding protein
VTEILFTLGLGNQLVAVDQFSDYPPGAKSILNIGGSRGSFNFEKIVELQPDVVLGAGPTPPETIQKLAELKLTVVIVGSRKSTMENIMDDIRLTGKIAGVPERAQQVTDAMQTKLTLLKAKVADARTKPKVYWEIDATNLSKPFSVGPGNFVNDIITLAGGENIFASTLSPFPQISTEQIVAASPDVIILVSHVTPESVKMRAGWDTISAVKNGRIFVVDENLTSRTGPRVVDGLEAAMKLIHPELFQ